jgi:hypothetical protein
MNKQLSTSVHISLTVAVSLIAIFGVCFCPQRDKRCQHGAAHRGVEQRHAVGQCFRLPLDTSACCQVL